MKSFIIRRLLQILLVLLFITMLVFLMVRLLPGDPILMYMTQQNMEILSNEQIDAMRHDLGLDRNIAVQYVDWLGHVVRGDLGKSIISHTSVAHEIAQRLPVSAYICGIAFVLSTLIGVPLGVIAAVRRGRWLDSFLTGFGNLGITIPTFWLGILLIYLFGMKLNMLPIIGYTSPLENFGDSIKHIILPVICLMIGPIAGDIRMARSTMLEVMRQDYIRTAWSKGLRERSVIITHALKNGLMPVVTLKGMGLAGIVGGSVIIEQVFSIPGIGRMAVNGIFNQDYAIVQGMMLMVGSVVLLSNLLVDISYCWLDPRIRYS
jgi:peptide/nickel transport system permease protein